MHKYCRYCEEYNILKPFIYEYIIVSSTVIRSTLTAVYITLCTTVYRCTNSAQYRTLCHVVAKSNFFQSWKSGYRDLAKRGMSFKNSNRSKTSFTRMLSPPPFDSCYMVYIIQSIPMISSMLFQFLRSKIKILRNSDKFDETSEKSGFPGTHGTRFLQVCTVNNTWQVYT